MGPTYLTGPPVAGGGWKAMQGRAAWRSSVTLPAVPGSAWNEDGGGSVAPTPAAAPSGGGKSSRRAVLPWKPLRRVAPPICATSWTPALCCAWRPGLLRPARMEWM